MLKNIYTYIAVDRHRLKILSSEKYKKEKINSKQIML